jgi:membrane protease YdiL (CAAX protease family)
MTSTCSLILETIPLFARLSRQHFASLTPHLRFKEFLPGEIVIAEGSRNHGRIYVVLEGLAAAVQKGRCPHDEALVDYEVAVHGRHEVLGAISLLDGEPLDHSVAAKTALKVAIVDFTAAASQPARRIKRIVMIEVRRHVLRHFRASLKDRVESLRREAEFTRYRNAVGHILVTALSVLSLYTLALSMLPGLQGSLHVNFAVSPIVILSFALIFLPVILSSGFRPAFFGIRLDNWREALSYSLRVSAVFLILLVAAKSIAIATLPSLSGLTVLSFADVRVAGQNLSSTSWYWAVLGLYMVLAPLQEFVARCGIQAPLYALLRGSELKRHALAILVSSLVFAAAHVHISLTFALAAFVPGLLWAYVFARTNSLLAASISHVLIGGAGIFLFGVEEFVRRLTQ